MCISYCMGMQIHKFYNENYFFGIAGLRIKSSKFLVCHFTAHYCSSIRKWQLKIYLALKVRQLFISESVSKCIHTNIHTFSERFTSRTLLHAQRNVHCHFFYVTSVCVCACLVGIRIRSTWAWLARRALPRRQLNWLGVLIYSGQHWRRTTAKRKSWCCCGNAAAHRHINTCTDTPVYRKRIHTYTHTYFMRV